MICGKMVNKRKRTMLGIISFIIAIAGLVTCCLLMMRRYRKRTVLNDGEAKMSEAGITLDKVYDDLLDFDSDDETPNNCNTEETLVPAVMKLKGRTFWTINKGIILSGATIILFAVGVATVSVLGQSSYAERKQAEGANLKKEQSIEKAADEERKVLEEKRMIELSKKLDSIDLHVRQMRGNAKQANKNRTDKK